jgi:hypothetical protein
LFCPAQRASLQDELSAVRFLFELLGFLLSWLVMVRGEEFSRRCRAGLSRSVRWALWLHKGERQSPKAAFTSGGCGTAKAVPFLLHHGRALVSSVLDEHFTR